MSRKKMKKRQSQRWHFKFNIHDRYGLFCNSTMHHKILDDVNAYYYTVFRGFNLKYDFDLGRNHKESEYYKTGLYKRWDRIHDGLNCEALLPQSNTRLVIKVLVPLEIFDERSILKVPAENRQVKIYVVYDTLRNEFCTALPWYETDEELLFELENNHVYERR